MIEILMQAIRSALLGPKDYFERQKRRLLRWMMLPLFSALLVPGLLTGLLSQVRFLEVNHKESVFKLAGNASSDIVVLIICLGIMFLFALGVNFLYGLHISKSTKDLEETQRQAELRQAYLSLRAQFFRYDKNLTIDASVLGEYIMANYPEFAKADPELIVRVFSMRGLALAQSPDRR